MNSINSGTCLVGSVLQGVCRGNAPRLSSKRDFIMLSRFNPSKLIFEGYAKCVILDKVNKLSQKEYLDCLECIRKNEYHPQTVLGDTIQGNEISCD